MLIEKEKEMLLSSSSFCRENIICPPLKPICTAHITNKSFIFPNAFFILYEYTFWVNKDTIPLLTTETKYSSSSFFSKASSFHKFCTCVVYRSCPSFPNIYQKFKYHLHRFSNQKSNDSSRHSEIFCSLYICKSNDHK